MSKWWLSDEAVEELGLKIDDSDKSKTD